MVGFPRYGHILTHTAYVSRKTTIQAQHMVQISGKPLATKKKKKTSVISFHIAIHQHSSLTVNEKNNGEKNVRHLGNGLRSGRGHNESGPGEHAGGRGGNGGGKGGGEGDEGG